jgi:hypothetical protein
LSGLHVALGVAFGFAAGCFVAFALGVITREPWAEPGRLIAGWRARR